MANLHIRQNIQSPFVRNVRANTFFSNLDHSRLKELDQMQQTATYPGGVVVFTEGDQPRGIYYLCSGRVKLSIWSSDGRAIIVSIVTAGDVFGVEALLSGKLHNLTAETVGLTQVCFIKKDDFLGFLSRNGDVSLRLA